MPSRRRVLLGVGVVALAGCSAESGPNTRVEEIQLINRDSTERRFALTVEVDETVAYEETHTVAPADREPILVLSEELPDERGRVTVTTRILGTDFERSHTYETEACQSLLVEYTSAGITYYSAENPDECETTTA